MTWTFHRRALPLTAATALASMGIVATAFAAAPSASACGDGPGDVQCAAECPADQALDAGSGECRATADQSGEAPLKQAWENAFGPLPSPEDFALARVEDPTVALPGVGLPGIGVNAFTIAPSIGGGVLGAAAPTVGMSALGLPAAPALPEVGLPALPAPPPLPGPPPMPCVGFGTPIPFVGFSTC